MSAQRIGHCLASAASTGYRVGIVDGRVRVRRTAEQALEGRPAADNDAWRAPLRSIAPREVELVLVEDISFAVARLDADTREAFEERAAILEYEAGLPREIAERVALCWSRRQR